jgi:hypothetical protein
MAEREVEVNNVPLGRDHPYEMSLVLQELPRTGPDELPEVHVVFVHWSSPEVKLGYTVTIRDGRAVYPAGQRRVDFTTAIVIHPAIRAIIQRKGIMYGQNFRTQIPPRILRLRDMWRASLGAWVTLAPKCFVCELDLGTSGIAHMCPLCLLASHEQCCRSVAADKAYLAGGTAVPVPPHLQLPLGFSDKLCALCLRWVG